jgi:SAM-dependent methyltransferase
MSATAGLARFERLYQQSTDPWGYRTSSYEQQKYAATLAALPRQTHGLVLEVGCSIGVFTGQLAARCAHVVAIDFSRSVLELARRNLQGVSNVDLLRASFPEETPPGSWDLIVCSEVLCLLRGPLLPAAASARGRDRLDQDTAQLWCERAHPRRRVHRVVFAPRHARRGAHNRDEDYEQAQQLIAAGGSPPRTRTR